MNTLDSGYLHYITQRKWDLIWMSSLLGFSQENLTIPGNKYLFCSPKLTPTQEKDFSRHVKTSCQMQTLEKIRTVFAPRLHKPLGWEETFGTRVQPRGGPQIGICNGVQNSRCPGNIRKIYIGCRHPHKPELGEGTRGAGPFRAVLHSNSCAANLWHSHLTYL